MIKLLKWLPINLAGILGILQAIVKCVKEILTVIVNILFPIIPDGKFEKVVLKVREVINKIDAILQRIKDFLLKMGG